MAGPTRLDEDDLPALRAGRSNQFFNIDSAFVSFDPAFPFHRLDSSR